EILVGDRWSFTANYSYIDAKYTEFPGSTVDITGISRPNIDCPYTVTPKQQLTLGARYLVLQSSEVGDLALSGQFYYQSAVSLDDRALVTPVPVGRQSGWSNVNLRADWTNVMGRTGVDASVFVRNATDD